MLCRSRRSFVAWCDEHRYALESALSRVGFRGDGAMAVRVVKLSDLDGFVGDRLECLDGFESRPDATIVARYAASHLRSAGDSEAPDDGR